MTERNYTLTARIVGSKWVVYVDPKAKYGYFEHDIEGEGGGLWFDRGTDGTLELADYDGVFELPMNVIKAIQSLGIIVAEVFMD